MTRCDAAPSALGDPRRGRELDGVALAVAEAEGVAAPARGAGHGQGRGRVDPSREEHDRVRS